MAKKDEKKAEKLKAKAKAEAKEEETKKSKPPKEYPPIEGITCGAASINDHEVRITMIERALKLDK